MALISPRFFGLAAALALLVPALSAEAQDRPPQRAPDGQVLPELAPREFEIRGDLEIAFPTLRRQPLIGFNPPPQVYEIPADREPYVEDYKQAAADLGTTPLGRPSPPGVSSLAGAPANRGQLELGAGRYFSRVARGWLNFPAGRRSAIQASLDYEGSDGHRPFIHNDDLRAPYQSFDGHVTFLTSQRNINFGVTLDGHSDAYDLFGARTALPVVPGNFSDYRPIPERMGYGMGAAVEFSTKERTGVPWTARVRYGTARYRTNPFVDDNREDPSFERDENRLDLHSDFRVPFGFGRVKIDGDLSFAGLDSDAFLRSDQFVFDAGGDVQFLYRNVFHITLGARMLGFRTSEHNGRAESAFYPMPAGSINLYPVQTLHLYFRNTPHIVRNDLTQIMRRNPYVLDQPVQKPDLAIVDAQGGAALYVRPLRIAGHAGLQFFENYLFFEPQRNTLQGIYRSGFFDSHYNKARILHFGGDVTLYVSSVLSANLHARWRNGRLTHGQETVIPNFAPLVAGTSMSYRFAENRGLVRVTGGFESSRYIDREESEKLDSYFDLSLFTSYDFRRGLGAFIQLDNMSFDGYERWAGYPQPTVVMMAGARLNW